MNYCIQSGNKVNLTLHYNESEMEDVELAIKSGKF